MVNRFYSSNAVETALTNPISNSATTIQVDSVAGYPTSFPFSIHLELGTANEEIIEVSNVGGTTLTVVRGVDGSSALAHSAGAKVVHGVSARDFREPQEHLSATLNVHGVGVAASVVGTSTAQTLSNKTLTAPSIADLTNAQHNHTSASKGGSTLGTSGSPVDVQAFNLTVRNQLQAVQAGPGYMKMVPGAFSPDLTWNPVPLVYTNDGSLRVEDNGLSEPVTRIRSPSGTTPGTVDPEISITSGATGGTSGGSISLNADRVLLRPLKQSWSPLWSAQTTAPSLGNANVDAKWWDLGQFAFFRLRIIFGNTSTFGTGLWSFSLPFTPFGISQPVTASATQNVGGVRWPGTALILNTSLAEINRITFTAGTSGAGSTNPFSWTTSDTLLVQGMVEK